jgi:hypothetical protein
VTNSCRRPAAARFDVKLGHLRGHRSVVLSVRRLCHFDGARLAYEVLSLCVSFAIIGVTKADQLWI